MNGLHVFIDNSNMYISAQGVARAEYFYDDSLVLRMRIDYGSLLEEIRNGRELGSATLVGSRPPANDSLWQRLDQMKIKCHIFERSPHTGKEKKVDAELTNCIRDVLEDHQKPGHVALVAGDRDYCPTLERVTKKGWGLEIYFWRDADAKELQNCAGGTFSSLNDKFKKITYLAKEQA